MTYFLPIWFQAITGVDALTSGIHTIPFILSMTLGLILAGGLTTKIGYYMPFVYAGVVLTSIGTGIITTWTPSTTIGQWIGYQIIFGLGTGLGFQMAQTAAQTILAIEDIAIGTAITFFAQTFGGAIFVSAANNVLNTRLVENIRALHIPSVDPLTVVKLGATQIRSFVPPEFLGVTIEAYNEALVKVFQVALICSCLTALGAMGMEWLNVKSTESAVKVDESREKKTAAQEDPQPIPA